MKIILPTIGTRGDLQPTIALALGLGQAGHTVTLPHNWLLPRSSGLIHHGSFGTASSGFRAGIPMLVIPYIIDQFIGGNKISESRVV